jgi:hypothetical protein
MKFYNQVLWKFLDITKSKPTDARLLISEKFKLPAIGEDDNGKVLYLPKPFRIKNGFMLNGLVFENTELSRILMMKTLMASMEHLGIHFLVSDFSLYDDWLKDKERNLARFVVDRIEDLCVNVYIKSRFNVNLKNIAVANAVSFPVINNAKMPNRQYFMQSALLSFMIARKSKFLIPSNYKKDIIDIVKLFYDFEKILMEKEAEPDSMWWYDDNINEKKMEIANSVYNILSKYGSSSDVIYLPYTDAYHTIAKSVVLNMNETLNVMPHTFRMLGLQFPSDTMMIVNDTSFKSDANSLMHDLIMEHVRKSKVLSNYKELLANTRFDDVIHPPQDIAEYARTYSQYKRVIAKICEDIKFMVNDFDADPNKDAGQIDMNAVIQARAAQSGNNNVFIREDTPKRTESWAILLDTSYSLKRFSMTPRDMALCLAEVAKEIIDWDSWSLFGFNNKFEIVKDLREIYGQDVRARIGGMRQSGLSFIPDALEVTSHMLIRSRAEYNYLFVISDGLAGGYSDVEERLVKTIKQLKRRGITIISLGVGTDGLKNYSYGPHVKIESAYDLLSKFARLYFSLIAN